MTQLHPPLASSPVPPIPPVLVEYGINSMFYKNALPNLGYEPEAAVADGAIDNGLDARATRLMIWTTSHTVEGIISIQMSDNGDGMENHGVFWILGVDHFRIPGVAHGKFGTGGVTSMLSLGKKIILRSKTKDGILKESFLDLDLVTPSHKGLPVSETRVVTDPAFISEFQETVGDHGTIFIVTKLHPELRMTNKDEFVKRLIDHCGLVYRRLLRKNKFELFVNGIPVTSREPILSMPHDKVYEKMINHGSKHFKVTVYHIRPHRKGTYDFGRSMEYQGFYCMRNDRQIGPIWHVMDEFKPHNDNNWFRCEIDFTDELDDVFNTNVPKNKLIISPTVQRRIWAEVEEFANEKQWKLKHPPVCSTCGSNPCACASPGPVVCSICGSNPCACSAPPPPVQKPSMVAQALRSDCSIAKKKFEAYIAKFPTGKFTPLVNQIMPHLDSVTDLLQKIENA